MTESVPSDRLLVRLLQTDPVLGDVDGNLQRLGEQVARASSCDLVVTPELATHGYHLGHLDEAPDDLAADDPRLAALGGHGPAVVVGFAERSSHHRYNSAALVTADGVRVQRKLFLPNYRAWEERKHFRPGGRLDVEDVAGTRTATLICNDAWQPPLPWAAAHDGAEVLVVPANSVVSDIGTPTSTAWDVILRHAAVALQSFVVFVNRAGDESGQHFWGGSKVFGPTGDVLGELGEEAGALDVELDLAELRRVRRQWPLLQETRERLIARTVARLGEDER